MRIAVVADLVPGGQDLAHALGVALRHPSRHEEGLAQVVPLEQLEDQGHGDLRAVGALGEHTGTIGVGRIVTDPDLLGVEVKREGNRSPSAPGPARHPTAWPVATSPTDPGTRTLGGLLIARSYPRQRTAYRARGGQWA